MGPAGLRTSLFHNQLQIRLLTMEALLPFSVEEFLSHIYASHYFVKYCSPLILSDQGSVYNHNRFLLCLHICSTDCLHSGLGRVRLMMVDVQIFSGRSSASSVVGKLLGILVRQ